MNGDPSMSLEGEQLHNANLLVGNQQMQIRRWSLAFTSTSKSDDEEKLQDGEHHKLSQYYQNAVDCLVHCESVIAKLQEQLSCKDDKIRKGKQQIAKLREQLFYKDVQTRDNYEQIANLEQRLIETKFELASTKALKDELSQALVWLKRQTSSADDSGNVNINLMANCSNKDKVKRSVVETVSLNAPQLRHPSQHQSNSPSTKTQILPSSAVHSSTRKNKVCGRAGRRLSRSWSSLSCLQSDFMPWPEHQDDEAATCSDDSEGPRRHPDLKFRGEFRQLSRQVPVGSIRKNEVCGRAERRLSRSWSASNRNQSEFMPWPEQQDDEADTSRDDCEGPKSHLDPKSHGGFSLSRYVKRLSWDISPHNSSLEESERSGHSQKGRGASVRCRGAANGSGVDLNNNKIGKPAVVVDRKTFAITNTIRRQTRLTADNCTGVSNKGDVVRKRLYVGVEDTPRLSSIGQFLLRLNKNDESNIKSITTSANNNKYDDREKHMNMRRLPSQQQQRKFKGSSCSIDGVMFPVLSDDCLVDIWKQETATKNFTTGSSCNSGKLHGRSPQKDHTGMRSNNSNRVNDNWQEFV